MSRPLRVLMTADAVGGVWQYALDLAAALPAQGVAPTIALLGPAPDAHQRAAAARAGVSLVDTGLPLDWLAAGPDEVLAAGEAVAALSREVDAEVVHLNSPALAAADAFDRPLVAVAHGCVGTWWRAAYGAVPDGAYRWHADLMRRGLLAADRMVAPSASFAADLQRAYALPATPAVVHNGRGPGAVAGERAPARHAFTAGRLWDRVKNTDVLDRAAARLPAPMRAAGPCTGPHGDSVAPTHLRLLGSLSEAEMAAEFAARPVFVSAASFEPFGLAVLEAAQAGCALVLSDIPTFRELWSGAAIFTPVGDDAVIAAAIAALLDDPVRRDALAGAAQARAGRYRPDRTAAHMASIYSETAETRRAAA